MKTKFVAKTKWEYYVANVAGILVILGLIVWCTSRAITETGVNFSSIFFWVAILLLVMLPFALIGFLSSMKAVEVTPQGLIISYVFQKHVNEFRFSEIARMESNEMHSDKAPRPRTLRDSFRLVLSDGRTFEFSQSQLIQYGDLKSVCRQRCKIL